MVDLEQLCRHALNEIYDLIRSRCRLGFALECWIGVQRVQVDEALAKEARIGIGELVLEVELGEAKDLIVWCSLLAWWHR